MKDLSLTSTAFFNTALVGVSDVLRRSCKVVPAGTRASNYSRDFKTNYKILTIVRSPISAPP